MNLNLYSQSTSIRAILDSNNDTIFSITKSQSKFLIFRHYKAEELANVNNLLMDALSLKDSTIKDLKQVNVDLARQVDIQGQVNNHLTQATNIQEVQITKEKKKVSTFKKILNVLVPIVVVESAILFKTL